MNSTEIQKFDSFWIDIKREIIDYILCKSDKHDFSKIPLHEYMKLYTIINNVLLLKSSMIPSKLNDKLEMVVKDYVTSKSKDIIGNGNEILIRFSNFWNAYSKIIIPNILKIFACLINANTRLRRSISVEEVLVNIVKEDIFDKVKSCLIVEYMNLISLIRGNYIDKGDFSEENQKGIMVLNQFTSFLLMIHINPHEILYDIEIEKLIIKEMIDYYKSYIAVYIDNKHIDIVDYLEKGLTLQSLEINFCLKFLPSKTLDIVKYELDAVIFYENSRILLENSLMNVYISNNIQSLSLIYGVFKEDVSFSIPKIISIYKEYLYSQLTSIQNNFINNLIHIPLLGNSFYNTYGYMSYSAYLSYNTNYIYDLKDFILLQLNVLSTCFENNNSFRIGLNEVLDKSQSVSINCQSSQVKPFNNSYIVAFTIDKYMNIDYKSSVKSVSDEETSIFLVNIISNLFWTIPDKDYFINTCQILLSNRLIQRKSISICIEKKIIQVLTSYGGEAFADVLYHMVKNYEESIDFSNSIENKECQTQLLIIEPSKWPKFQIGNLKMDGKLMRINESIVEFYKTIYINRNIRINHYKSTFTIEAKLKNRNLKMEVNTFQACILLLFNSSRNLSEEMIISQTEMEKSDFFSAVKMLTDSNFLLVNKSNNSYSVNMEYENEQFINVFPLFLQENNSSSGNIKTDDDRQYSIEAAIVRVMKRRKYLNYEEIVKEVNEDIFMFHVNTDLLKKRMENLVDREIILRDDDRMGWFKYNY